MAHCVRYLMAMTKLLDLIQAAYGVGRHGLLLGGAAALLAGLPLAEKAAWAASEDEAASEAQASGTAAAAQVGRTIALGDYLAGLHASRHNDLGSAADYMLLTLEQDPDNFRLLQDTFTLVSAEGRHVEAVRLARRILAKDEDHGSALLVLLIDAVDRDDLEGAEGYLNAMGEGGINRILRPMLEGWLKVGRGDFDSAMAAIEALKENDGFEVLERLHTALMHDVTDQDAAATRVAYEAALEAAPQPALRMVWITGNFMERQGDAEAATALYDSYLQDNDGSGVFEPATRRLSEGSKPHPVVDDYVQGIAETLFNLSGLLTQERAERMALLQVHLALRLDPEFVVARILHGEILEDQDRSLEAISAYRQIDPASPFTWTARLRIAEQLDELGRTDEAAAELEALAEDWSDHYEPLYRLGNLLRGQERFSEAADAYDRAFERLGESQQRHWTLHYLRGIALERSDQWDRAEVDFLKALELEPEQPYVMNYLAYSWVEQKRNLDQAKEMLARAVELRPTDGFIVDSLGWVFYRLDDFEEAVTHLEKAVELRPQDPVINDHLGDAYWKVGRYQEARFQWRRALSLEPEADLIPVIEAKIEKGLQAESERI